MRDLQPVGLLLNGGSLDGNVLEALVPGQQAIWLTCGQLLGHKGRIRPGRDARKVLVADRGLSVYALSVDWSLEVAPSSARRRHLHQDIIERPRIFAPFGMNLGIREATVDVISEEVLRSWHPGEQDSPSCWVGALLGSVRQ